MKLLFSVWGQTLKLFAIDKDISLYLPDFKNLIFARISPTQILILFSAEFVSDPFVHVKASSVDGARSWG